jgi:hypothetical protein
MLVGEKMPAVANGNFECRRFQIETTVATESANL